MLEGKTNSTPAWDGESLCLSWNPELMEWAEPLPAVHVSLLEADSLAHRVKTNREIFHPAPKTPLSPKSNFFFFQFAFAVYKCRLGVCEITVVRSKLLAYGGYSRSRPCITVLPISAVLCLYRSYFRWTRITIFRPFPLGNKCSEAVFTFRELSWTARSCFVRVRPDGPVRGWGLQMCCFAERNVLGTRSLGDACSWCCRLWGLGHTQ